MVLSRLPVALMAFAATCGVAVAHPGGLDANGGHHDRKNGGYHYHGGSGGGGGGGGGGGIGFTNPHPGPPPPRRIIYTPPPKRTFAPRKPHEPSYAVTHGLKLHTFHTNKGKILTRGEAFSLIDGNVTIIRVNGDKVVKPFAELAIVDQAKVAFDLALPEAEKPEAGAFDMFGSPPIAVDPGVKPTPRVNSWEVGFRTWTSADGIFTVKAKAAGLTDTKVLLRVENQTRIVAVAIEKLSEADRQYLVELKEAATVPTREPSEVKIAAE